MMRKDSGFSLGELITVMGILTVLAAVAIPALVDWRNKSQLGRAARDVYSVIQKTKSEAVKRNRICKITFSANDFVVYVDGNSDWIYDAGEEIIGPVSWDEYPGISLGGLPFTLPVGSVAFFPDGLPRNNAGDLGSGVVALQGSDGKTAQISLLVSGSVQIN